jgi:hypothetical protein
MRVKRAQRMVNFFMSLILLIYFHTLLLRHNNLNKELFKLFIIYYFIILENIVTEKVGLELFWVICFFIGPIGRGSLLMEIGVWYDVFRRSVGSCSSG